MTFPDEQSPAGADEAAAAGPAQAGGADEGAGADLQGVLADARAQAEQAREQFLRTAAEFENFRKRSVREVDQARKFAVERFASELIGVKDSLELALAAENTGPQAGSAMLAGVEATLKLLARAFEKEGLTEIQPLGEAFNPELHEAMATQPSVDHPPHTVLQVVQKGYVLNGRLLRPARVIVARAP